jgi:hypothetical protein
VFRAQVEGFVSDIFQEVDEEVRREQLKKYWDRFGNYIVALVIVIVVGIGGWRGYTWWEEKRAAETGAAFEAAMALSQQGKHAEAQAAFGKIASEGTRGYHGLALLREAAEIDKRDPKAASALYDRIAADRAVAAELRDLATLRGSAVLIDTTSYEDVRQRLEPLTTGSRTFRHAARELLAFAAWRAGDMASTKRWLDIITSDAETPSGIRSRVDMLAALVAAESKS